MAPIGKKILLKRKELGLTQEELAIKMGYKSKSTINKIELGINDIPQSKIVKFAEALDTTPAGLMGWTDEIEQDPEAAANKAADILLDPELGEMVDVYSKLSGDKRKQALEYMMFLLNR